MGKSENAVKPLVGVVMGSESDLSVMEDAAKILQQFGVSFEIRVVSAHRTPEAMLTYAQSARERGLRVLIAGAGGAAHLPGMLASLTTLPVIGVPVKSKHSMEGWDSVLSILQMPGGVPVATVALNGAKNAAILAVQVLATADEALATKLSAYKKELQEIAFEQDKRLR